MPIHTLTNIKLGRTASGKRNTAARSKLNRRESIKTSE